MANAVEAKASEMQVKMRRWSYAKLAKELAMRDDNGGDADAVAWCWALEAERDRRYGKPKQADDSSQASPAMLKGGA